MNCIVLSIFIRNITIEDKKVTDRQKAVIIVTDVFLTGIEDISFRIIESVLDFIATNMSDEKMLLVIDELPYWAEKDETLLSVDWRCRHIYGRKL